MKPFLIYLTLVIFLASCQPNIAPQGMTVEVQKVISGQTLEVAATNRQIMKVRLIGIDAPDLRQQPWGKAAKAGLEAMLIGKRAVIELEAQPDEFGRRLAYIWCDRLLINEEIVNQGYVLASPQGKYAQRLILAQEWARLMERGIWNPSQPMRLTPAEFRSQYR
ncbi:thermonuclease family protein [Aliterella atlantica]|uniref:Nuclease n=1 Tax=Aliterella atlantica CENA595 TaxID=1618023 RepID=A0A0D8ZN93_9CYAN|nr:thermonuclease family protein [Aliterella atlantica]KJH70210.1 nuclease [Aliterella atlantica CENA595]